VGEDGIMSTVLKYWDAATSTWKPFLGDVPAPTASIVVKGAVTGTVDGTNNVFNTGSPYVAGTLQAYINGITQSGFVVETNPLTGAFSFATAPPNGADIKVYFHKANTGLGNADTVDNYNANAVPTANNIPVLDSGAKLPVATLPFTRTTDANGWTVIDYGTWKEYTRYLGTAGAGGAFTFGAYTGPVGVNLRTALNHFSFYSTFDNALGAGTGDWATTMWALEVNGTSSFVVYRRPGANTAPGSRLFARIMV
jgi:hypothetical protein